MTFVEAIALQDQEHKERTNKRYEEILVLGVAEGSKLVSTVQ
jgi:hypothetical protein